jgi:hypothetical protein
VERCKERDLTLCRATEGICAAEKPETGEIKETDVFMGDFP